MTADGARMAAGIASLAAHERARREQERLDAERAAARPAPPEIADRPGRAERLLALSVPCRFCGAAVGRSCVAHTRGRPECAPHPSRLDAAQAALPLVLPTGFPPVVPIAQPTKGV